MACSVAAELRQLAELHQDGRLTDAEFSTAKALVLQLPTATEPTPPPRARACCRAGGVQRGGQGRGRGGRERRLWRGELG